MFFKYINICWAPREVLKPLSFRLWFQHLPRGPADVNAQKIMFDPYNGCVGWTENLFLPFANIKGADQPAHQTIQSKDLDSVLQENVLCIEEI